MTEHEVITRHVSRCRFCQALLAHSRRRSDRALLDAADQVAWEHAENEAEREAFARSSATAHATAQARSSSMRMAILGGDPR